MLLYVPRVLILAILLLFDPNKIDSFVLNPTLTLTLNLTVTETRQKTNGFFGVELYSSTLNSA